MTSPAVCQVWKEVRASHKDTPETITQVVANNAARRCVCEGECPHS